MERILACLNAHSLVTKTLIVLFVLTLVLVGMVDGFTFRLTNLYADLVFGSLGGRPDISSSAIHGWGLWNQYTNTAYINMITYSLGWVGSIALGYLWAVIAHRPR